MATLAVVALLFINAVVNAVSVADSRSLALWEPMAWELTSAMFFAALLLPLWQLRRRCQHWPALAQATTLAALTVPVAAVHVAWLAASRSLVYSLAGRSYGFASATGQWLFEWRKDALTLLVLVGLGWLLDRIFTLPVPVAPAPPPFRLAVKDGTRTILLAPDEISHASSAGNYVELATVHGRLLHRITLAALVTELAPHGFARIHRAHLVRSAAVVAVTNEGSGDFTVTLGDGIILPGSRRYRQALAILGARS